MQVLECRRIAVERDMDLTREILLSIEHNPQMDGTREFYISDPEEIGITGCSIEELSYHFALLIEAGFVDGATTVVSPVIVRRLTWKGHEFLANVKNDDIWSTTKKRLSGLQGIALSVVAAIAESEIKKKLGLTP